MARKKKMLTMLTVALIAFACMFGIGAKKVYASSDYYEIKFALDGKGTVTITERDWPWLQELKSISHFDEKRPNVLCVDKAKYDQYVAGEYDYWRMYTVLDIVDLAPKKGYSIGSPFNYRAYVLKDASKIKDWDEFEEECDKLDDSKLEDIVNSNNEVTIYIAWAEEVDTLSLKVTAPLCGEQVKDGGKAKVSFSKDSHCYLGSYFEGYGEDAMYVDWQGTDDDPWIGWNTPIDCTYKGGDKAYIYVRFMENYGYFINPEIEAKDITVTYTDWQGKEVKGKVAAIIAILADGIESDANYIVLEVEAQHVPGPTVIENQVKPTKTKDGSHDEVIYCKKCHAELKRKKVPHKVGVLLAQFKNKGKKQLILSWNKLKYVEGYDIFFAKCNKKDKKTQCKLIATINGNKTFSWTTGTLKKNTAYKAYVAAWVKIKGKKTYIRESLTVHSFTGGFDKEYSNPKSLTVNKRAVSLKKGKKFTIVTTIKKVKENRKLISKNHTRSVRYISTNPKIATVDYAGNIVGKAKGTCTVHVVMVNGLRKDIKVTVK